MSDQHTDQPDKGPHEGVSEFVRRLRERIASDKSLTAASLARRSGFDDAAIRQLLLGRAKSPKLDTVLRIMEALDTTYEEFMGKLMSPAEREIVRLVDRLPVAEQRQLLGFAKALAGPQPRKRRAKSEESPKP